MDRNKLLKMVVILACIVVIMSSISRLFGKNSMTLIDYAKLHPTPLPEQSMETDFSDSASPSEDDASESPDSTEPASSEHQEGPDKESSLPPDSTEPPEEEGLTGEILNGSSMLEQRVLLAGGFYYEPLSDKLKRYITGISYPDPGDGAVSSDGSTAPSDGGTAPSDAVIGLDELRYVHILYVDYDGNSRPGELICNEYIAQDLTEIFYELYNSEYRLESVLLIDEYGGDDTASMEANNTSCFNHRPITGGSGQSMHAYGLAIDINPLYNPYVAYKKDGSVEVLPASAQPYADRQQGFPYKIDENDLCYKLFTQHGFIWGGNWNNIKDYQHFQKAKP